MIYYIFNTESEALATEQQIVDNVKNWILVNVPEALSPDGTKLRGRNAATGQLVDVYTTRWAIPQQINSGLWVFPKPTIDKTTPIPVEVFTEGISVLENNYDPAWFIGLNTIN